MKYFACLIFLGFALVPQLRAQDHGQVGVYADYVRLAETSTNMVGIGGRLAVNANSVLAFEAEMNYDFQKAFNEGFKNSSNGSVTFTRSNVRLLQGLFGPTLETPQGPLRGFVTVKGGFINFSLSSRPATFATFASTIQNLRRNNVSGVLYPGGGVEVRVGPFGLRLDVGDDIYFAGGAHNNLRAAFGPFISF